MRVLLVNDYDTPTGGAEIQMLNLRERLRALGHDARLFSSSARPRGAPPRADYACFGTLSRWRTLLQAFNPWAYFRLRRVLREFEPDAVWVGLFLTQLSPLILPLLRGVPSLYYAMWYRSVCPIGTKLLPDGSVCRVPAGLVCWRGGCLPLRDLVVLTAQATLFRRWRSAFRRIVTNSDTTLRVLNEGGLAASEGVYHGVPAVPQRPPLQEPPTVAFAGRLAREKGVDVLLRAFARVERKLPSARLLLAGDGVARDALRREANRLGLVNVEWLGHLEPALLEASFSSAWVQAVPSQFAEPFGLVAAEATMRGTAVVATRAGGLAEIVEDGTTGLLVPMGDEEALAKALTDLLSDRRRAEEMGAAGRISALRRFSLETAVDGLLRVTASMRDAGGQTHG